MINVGQMGNENELRAMKNCFIGLELVPGKKNTVSAMNCM